MTDAEAATYCAVLSWFAKRHSRGSQTSHWNRWIPRAIEEIGDIGIPIDQLAHALEYLHDRGFIETRDGTGSFLGAKVTDITDRGYRFLDRLQGDPVDDADVIIVALQAVIVALGSRAPQAARYADELEALRTAKDELEARPQDLKGVLDGLQAVANSLQTVAAVVPAWNSLAAIASTLGYHGLRAITGT